MSNAEYVKMVLLSCPAITNEAGEFDLHIDQLGKKPANFSIEAEPTGQTVKRYLGGDSQKQFSFSLMARKDTFTDDERARNNEAYEELSAWLSAQSRYHRLPPMGDNKTPMSMAALGNPYLMEADQNNNAAIYSLQCELIYIQKGGN